MKYPLVAVVLCALCLLVYAGSLQNGFVFDDHFLVVNNRHIKSAEFIPRLLTEELFVAQRDVSPVGSRYFRPLQALGYAAGHMVWGMKPAGFRAFNILIHAFCGVLLYALIVFLFKGRTLAFITAALFCAHPLQVSNVALISLSSVLLAGLFMLASLNFFLRFISAAGKKRLFPASLVCFALAVLSREDALLLPLFAGLSALYVSGRKRKAVWYFCVFAALGAAYWLLRQYFLACPQMNPSGFSLGAYFYHAIDYFGQLLFPVTLRAMLFPAGAGPLADRVAFGAGLATFGWFLFYALKKREKTAAFGLLWYSIGVLPLAGLSESVGLFGPVISEHYVYFASAGFCLLLCQSLLWLRASFPKAAAALTALLLCACVGLSALFTGNYKDDLVFYNYLLRTGKKTFFFRVNLATAYYERQMFEEALGQARLALVEEPGAWDAYLLIGNVLKERGELEGALRMYEKAALAQPSAAVIFNNMALVHKARGNPQEALRYFKKALDIDPDFPLALNNLSAFLIDRGRYQEALAAASRLIETDPANAAAYVLKGIALAQTKDPQGALKMFEAALKIDPRQLDALRNLGVLYSNAGDAAKARYFWNQVLKLSPKDSQAIQFLNRLDGSR
ncbi:MAG: tetratricopeptide repeat protein [Candidatus Omnitrophica bacterium]|nr:tetratricopeptide repeat protein [Candidatus Omnitrophota bacterium]